MDFSKTKKGLPLYRLSIDKENDDHTGVAVSFVGIPASLTTMVRLGSHVHQVPILFEFTKDSLNDEKHTVTGVMIRANYPMYRKQKLSSSDEKEMEFNAFFEAKDVEHVMVKMMKTGSVNKINIEHEPDNTVDGIYLVESFILTDSHKVNYSQFKDVEAGSWIVTYKVDNDVVWDGLKSGKINGISPEVISVPVEVQQNSTNFKHSKQALIW
jgi:hypothetical protein